jgi:hypothetical protein
MSPVILLVLRDQEGNLLFRVHPKWRAIVQSEDLVYLQSLTSDFQVRAKLHPADLFQQLSSLEVGPLATQVVGADLRDHPELQELSSTFVQL